MNLQQLKWTLGILDNPSSHIHHPEFNHMKEQMIQTVQESCSEEVFEPVQRDIGVPDKKWII